METITQKQKEVLNGIIQFYKERGFSPTVRELCEITGLKSTSSVSAHLNVLEQKGYITKDSTKPRTITVLKEAVM